MYACVLIGCHIQKLHSPIAGNFLPRNLLQICPIAFVFSWTFAEEVSFFRRLFSLSLFTGTRSAYALTGASHVRSWEESGIAVAAPLGGKKGRWGIHLPPLVHVDYSFFPLPVYLGRCLSPQACMHIVGSVFGGVESDATVCCPPVSEKRVRVSCSLLKHHFYTSGLFFVCIFFSFLL